MPSYDDIVDAAKAARRDLADLEIDLQEEIDEIRFEAFREGRALTQEETATRNARRAEKAEARAAYTDMMFITLQRLNDSMELQQLNKKMSEIIKGLSDDLERLKRIERYASIAAKVADGLTKVAGKIASLAT